MKLLLDSHTLVWSADAPKKLSPSAAAALQDPANELLVSAATVWEIAIKLSLGKLQLTLPYRQWMNQAIADLDLTLIPITVEYVDVQVTLPYHHRDPFDRLLVAQALSENCPIVSVDSLLDPYGITRLW
jgi:PIN domain nuclease of toxin-antitoxin system